MAYYGVGEAALRAENIDRVVQGVALMKYKLKQVMMTPSSSAWSESYYRETTHALTPVAGIPRLAAFPVDTPDWEKNTAYMVKHGLEGEIPWEDAISNNIDVIQRVLLRISSAVAKSVDDAIYTALSGATGINTTATNAEWNFAATRSSRLPHEDVGKALGLITAGAQTNYEPDTLLVNPTDYTYLVTNDYVVDSFDASSPDLMRNGVMGRFLGLKVIVTPSVTADQAMVLQSKVCGTYRTLKPLTTARKVDEGIKYIIRAWEVGVPFVTNPSAICTITNTHA